MGIFGDNNGQGSNDLHGLQTTRKQGRSCDGGASGGSSKLKGTNLTQGWGRFPGGKGICKVGQMIVLRTGVSSRRGSHLCCRHGCRVLGSGRGSQRSHQEPRPSGPFLPFSPLFHPSSHILPHGTQALCLLSLPVSLAPSSCSEESLRSQSFPSALESLTT